MALITRTAQDRLAGFSSTIRNNTLEYLANGPYKTALNTQEVNQAFTTTNTSYSGTDCTVIAIVNEYMLVLGNASTFSYSVHREKMPVRTLGHTYPKNFTYGSRTIAGHMIFVTFDEHPLSPLFNFFNNRTSAMHRYSSPLSDDLPPVDLILLFNNESGSASVIRLYGLEFQDDGYVVSINDIYSETSMQFLARDMDPMVSAGGENSWKRLIFNKQLEGRVVDEYYASLLQYQARLEREISQMDEEIFRLQWEVIPGLIAGNRIMKNQTQRDAHQGLIENTEQYRVDRIQRGHWAARKEQIDLKRQKKENLQQELQTLRETILNYENRVMTWDHNSAIERSPNDARFSPFGT